MKKLNIAVLISIIAALSNLGFAGPGVGELFTIFFILTIPVPWILSYKIAKKKNRSAGGWLVASLFFGWLALIIVALLPDNVNSVSTPTPKPTLTPANQVKTASTGSFCASCGSKILNAGAFCASCGTKII